MRIISYNILDGGIGRADPLAEVILAHRPDIVVLVEADDLAVVERIAGRGKMDFVHALGGKKGAAILSHWPIRETIDHAALGRNDINSMLEATVIRPDGFEWIIGALHLHPRAREEDERCREVQIAWALDIFNRHRDANRPHLLVGDFNSNSPVQQIDVKKTKQTTQEAWSLNGGQVPRRVVQRILDAGYLDSLAAADPQQARTGGTFTTQEPGQRVDYIFTFGFDRARIHRAWIEQDRLAKYASDHFPIGAEID